MYFYLDKMSQNQQQVKKIATSLRAMGDSLHNKQTKRNQWGSSSASSSKSKQSSGHKSYTTQYKSYKKY